MTKTADFSDMFTNMMDPKMFDAMPANDMLKSVTEFSARMNGIVLEAAAKNTELAFGWTRDTLDNMQKFANPDLKPAEFAKVTGDMLNAHMRATPELVTKLAEVAKTAQTKTVELVMETGKSMQSEAVAKANEMVKKAA